LCWWWILSASIFNWVLEVQKKKYSQLGYLLLLVDCLIFAWDWSWSWAFGPQCSSHRPARPGKLNAPQHVCTIVSVVIPFLYEILGNIYYNITLLVFPRHHGHIFPSWVHR
jgi:hypothetical protein